MKTPDPLYWQNLRAKSLAKNPLKRSVIKSKPVKIKPVSEKRKKELREYEKVKAVFFATKEHCEYPGCYVTELTCHHSAGRIGKNLTDISTFRALCEFHHRWAEVHVIEAKNLGLSVDRLSNN